jgi:ribosomal protein L25 (general stress protein Ctc)
LHVVDVTGVVPLRLPMDRGTSAAGSSAIAATFRPRCWPLPCVRGANRRDRLPLLRGHAWSVFTGSRKLRADGKVPGVCNGSSVDGRIEPLPIAVDVKQLRAALEPVRKRNTVISLTIEGDGAPRSLHALVKDF